MKKIHKKDQVVKMLSRRHFLQGSAAAVGAAGIGIGIAPGAAKAGVARTKTLIYVFLRGGLDGLSLVVPTGGVDHPFYANARDRTYMDLADGIHPLGTMSGTQFGLHPFCDGLKQLYDSNRLAIVQAVGHPPGTFTRSHFDAQEQIELGTPGEQGTNEGWLAKHLRTSPIVPVADAIFTAMVSSNSPPVSIAGWPDVATLDSPDSFHPNSGTFGNTHLQMLRQIYDGSGSTDLAAQSAVDAVDLISNLDLGDSGLQPPSGVTYPNSGFGRDLDLIAKLIKSDLGIAAAAVERNGWDTHNQQNNLGNNNFGSNVRDLSDGLNAFYRDLAINGRGGEVAIIVQSEFGRQVSENNNAGTDHGLGNPMLVIGENVNGGAMYGTFPGLATGQRESDSLLPTTDFRQVLGTVMDRLVDNPNVEDVFEDSSFNYSPLGLA